MEDTPDTFEEHGAMWPKMELLPSPYWDPNDWMVGGEPKQGPCIDQSNHHNEKLQTFLTDVTKNRRNRRKFKAIVKKKRKNIFVIPCFYQQQYLNKRACLLYNQFVTEHSERCMQLTQAEEWANTLKETQQKIYYDFLWTEQLQYSLWFHRLQCLYNGY